MKTLTIILSIIGLVSLNSCNQQKSAEALLKNPETRTEVFNAISENHDYMSEFMEDMHKSESAMQMMQGEGMQRMIKDSMMMKNMMDNKPMMNSMMNRMMNDGKMMGTMMKMMHEKGMMSEDWYGILHKNDGRKRNGYACRQGGYAGYEKGQYGFFHQE